MPIQQSRIDGFLSPSESRTRKRAPKASAEAIGASGPGIQLNFVDPRSYTVTTARRTKNNSDQTVRRGNKEGRGRRPKYGQEEKGTFNARPASSSATAPAKRKREWDVISENSDDAKSVGSEEGTPERLGAVRLETAKSQLQWGERGRGSGSSSSGSSEGSEAENEEEERQKRRVVVSGEDSDGHTPPPAESEVIDLESEPDAPTRKTPPIRSSPQDPLADMFSDIPDPTQPSSSGYTRAARRPPPITASSSNNRRRRRRREPTPEEESSVYESEDPERIIASPPPYRRAPPSISKGLAKEAASQAKKRKRGKRGVVDPDEEDEQSEEEDPEALVKELEMDTPGEFCSFHRGYILMLL